MDNNTSPEFNLLASTATYIRKDFKEGHPNWKNSPFEWILHLPPASKGKLGKLLVYQWCATKLLGVDKSPDSEADMTINGHRIEVKFSTLWKNGIYAFEQIRDQNYEYCICLGISPFDAHCWVISKPVLLRYVIGHMGQHTGSSGKDTAWIPINPKKPPEWLSPYGGTLEDAYKVLKSIHRKKII